LIGGHLTTLVREKEGAMRRDQKERRKRLGSLAPSTLDLNKGAFAS
jgi:hypothetical protein